MSSDALSPPPASSSAQPLPSTADSQPLSLTGPASFCAPGGAFCVAWGVRTASAAATVVAQSPPLSQPTGRRSLAQATATTIPSFSGPLVEFTVSAATSGYVSLGFTDVYGAMAPADCYAAWTDPATGIGGFAALRNPSGHESSVPVPLPVGARLLSASSSSSTGRLTASFLVPPPPGWDVPGFVANLIWAVAGLAPSDPLAGPFVSHGPTSGVDFGALSVALSCASGEVCLKASGARQAGPFDILHRTALVGFASTLCACIALRAAAAASPAVAAVVLGAPLARLAPPPVSHWGVPEAALLTGYAATFAVFLLRSLALYPASPAKAVGALAAPAVAAALLPVSRASLLWHALGVSYERAAFFHRAAACAFIAVVAAHVALEVREAAVVGAAWRDTLTMSIPNDSGRGNAHGTASASAFAALALFALPPVRRASFLLFKACSGAGCAHVLSP